VSGRRNTARATCSYPDGWRRLLTTTLVLRREPIHLRRRFPGALRLTPDPIASLGCRESRVGRRIMTVGLDPAAPHAWSRTALLSSLPVSRVASQRPIPPSPRKPSCGRRHSPTDLIAACPRASCGAVLRGKRQHSPHLTRALQATPSIDRGGGPTRRCGLVSLSSIAIYVETGPSRRGSSFVVS